MNYLEAVKGWKWLMEQIQKIPEPARKTYHDALLARALAEWGFNPENPAKKIQVPFTEEDLADWQREFLRVLRESDTYGFLVESAIKEFKQNMYEFVREGGSLSDIPRDMRSAYVIDAYFTALKKWYCE